MEMLAYQNVTIIPLCRFPAGRLLLIQHRSLESPWLKVGFRYGYIDSPPTSPIAPTLSLKKIAAGIQLAIKKEYQVNPRRKGLGDILDLNLPNILVEDMLA